MSNEAVIAVVVGAVVLVLAIVVIARLAMSWRQRRHLREQFGPEYSRVVDHADNRRDAEQELTARERRHGDFDLRQIPAQRRAEYQSRWTAVQEHFVDTPDAAVGEADELVTIVMAERGYPTNGYQQQVADLSVEHARTLDHYRAAHEVNERRRDETTSTEDLRQAMVHYRALFDDLLGTRRQA